MGDRNDGRSVAPGPSEAGAPLRRQDRHRTASPRPRRLPVIDNTMTHGGLEIGGARHPARLASGGGPPQGRRPRAPSCLFLIGVPRVWFAVRRLPPHPGSSPALALVRLLPSGSTLDHGAERGREAGLLRRGAVHSSLRKLRSSPQLASRPGHPLCPSRP